MRFAALAAFVLLFAGTTFAEDRLVIRAYDVRDLLIVIPDFSDAPDFRLAATTQPTTAPATQPAEVTRQKLVDDLKRSMQVLLAETAGATVIEKDGQLLIAAPADRHDRIATALDAVRKLRAAQISIETRVITVSNAAIQKLDPAIRVAMDSAILQDRQGVPFDEAQVTALLKGINSDGNAGLLTAPRVTVFHGQHAYVQVSTSRAYIRELKVIVKDGKRAFDSVIDTFDSGVLVDVSAYAAVDGSAVSLEARVEVAQLLGITDHPAPGTKPEEKAIIQVPDGRVFELKRTVTLPTGQSALYKLPAVPAEKASPDQQTFVLFKASVVKPTIINGDAGEQKQFPLLNSKIAE